MQASTFKAQGAAMYGGYGWMTRMAEDMGVNVSTIHRYATGAVDIPKRVELALDALRAARVREIEASSSVASADPTSARNAGAGLSLPTPAPTADPQ